MADEPKLVTARDLPATIGEAPPPKRNSADIADVADLAKFGNIPLERARKILESKDGRTIRAVANGLVPPLVDYIENKVKPLQARIAELTSEISQIRSEWQAVLSQRKVKTIKTRRENGQLVADVFEGDGTPINKYFGTWKADNEYDEGAVVTHDGSGFIAKKSTREKPGASDSWQLFVKRGKDGRDAR